jgi:hypothetical protein
VQKERSELHSWKRSMCSFPLVQAVLALHRANFSFCSPPQPRTSRGAQGRKQETAPGGGDVCGGTWRWSLARPMETCAEASQTTMETRAAAHKLKEVVLPTRLDSTALGKNQISIHHSDLDSTALGKNRCRRTLIRLPPAAAVLRWRWHSRRRWPGQGERSWSIQLLPMTHSSSGQRGTRPRGRLQPRASDLAPRGGRASRGEKGESGRRGRQLGEDGWPPVTGAGSGGAAG